MKTLKKRLCLHAAILGLCAIILVGSFGCRRRPSKPLVMVTLDWNFLKDNRYEYLPINTSGRLFASYYKRPATKFGPVSQVTGYKLIGGKRYFGVRVHKEGPESYEKPEATLLEFYLRPTKAITTSIDMYLNTKVTCELRIDNFLSGSLRHFESKEKLTLPYVFTPEKYHLEALIEQARDER